MHMVDLLDVAITLADLVPVASRVRQRLSETSLQEFWSASRQRFDAWGRKLREAGDELSGARCESKWLEWTPFFEEVLVSELVTRLVATLWQELDEHLGLHEYGPLGRSAFTSHLDARARVLGLLVGGHDQSIGALRHLNRLRWSVERWTDLLLAQSSGGEAIALSFCFDSQRWRVFRRFQPDAATVVWPWLRVAAREVFSATRPIMADHRCYYEQMQGAICGSWSDQLFRDTGIPMSRWQTRLMALTDDTEGMLAAWFDGADSAVSAVPNDSSTGVKGRFRCD